MPQSLRSIAHQSLSLTQSAYLKHYQRGKFKVERGVSFTGSELPGPGFNFAACLGPCPLLADVEQMGRAFFGEADKGWGILVEGDAGHPIEAELIAAGWKVDEDEPAFLSPLSLGGRGAGGEGDSVQGYGHESRVVIPLTPNPSPAEGEGDKAKAKAIRQFTTEADRIIFERIATIAFNAPPEFGNLIMPSASFLCDPAMGWFGIDVNGETVGVGGYYMTVKTAVICCIATLPEHRGQGLGAAIVNHCLDHAASKGCTRASLRSGPKSVPLYKRLGFQYVCQHRTYAAPAVS